MEKNANQMAAAERKFTTQNVVEELEPWKIKYPLWFPRQSAAYNFIPRARYVGTGEVVVYSIVGRNRIHGGAHKA